MAHQVDSVRVDVEFLANESEGVHHIELAQFPEILRISGRSEADGSGPANAVTSVIVVPHRRDDDVSALFRELREISKPNLVARLHGQTVQRHDERRRT